MKYYLKHIESIDKFTIACYSNDELLFEKRINPAASNLLSLSSYEYELNEIIFGLSCSLKIKKNSDFYFIHNNKKPLTIQRVKCKRGAKKVLKRYGPSSKSSFFCSFKKKCSFLVYVENFVKKYNSS